MKEKPTVNNSLLELHVPDFLKVKDYYGKFGFKVVWERQPEGFKGYLVMKLQNNILCFWAGNKHVYEQDYFRKWSQETKRGYGVEIVLMVNNVDALYEKVKNKIEIYEHYKLAHGG